MTAPSTSTPVQTGLQALRVVPQAVSLVREGAGKEFALSSAALVVVGLVPAGILLCSRLLVDQLTRSVGWNSTLLHLLLIQLALVVLGIGGQAISDYWRAAMRERLQQSTLR